MKEKTIENAWSILLKFGKEENLQKLQAGQFYMKNLQYYVDLEKGTSDEDVGDMYDGQMMLQDVYSQIDGCTNETVIWLDEPKPPKELRKFFKCYDSFDAIKDKLKYLLLTAHSKSKKAHEYSEKLVNGLKILALIRKHPGISTQKLSELTELPLRSVQRYIAALQATGEWIEYDRALRGWKLFHGISILYGDV